MNAKRDQAEAEFRKALNLIAVISVLMVIGALAYLYVVSTLDTDTVIAVTLGVFLSVFIGCGLIAAAYFSDKSGHDQRVSDATSRQKDSDGL